MSDDSISRPEVGMTWREHRRCLLISNSTAHGEGYLDHCQAEILAFLGGRDRLAFVPFVPSCQGVVLFTAEDRCVINLRSAPLSANSAPLREITA